MAKDPVLSALAQQVDCYCNLAKLAALQHEHVQNSRTEELLTVLSQRQGLIDQVADLEQSIGPAKKRWQEYLGELPDEDRSSAQQLLDRTRSLLEQITASDRNDALMLQQRKLNLGKQINDANNARRFNRTYAAAAYGQRPPALNIQR